MTARLAPLVIFLGLCMVLAACSGEPGGKQAQQASNDVPVSVVTAKAIERAYAQPIDGIATLRAREGVVITAPASGRVRQVLFREGQTVRAGAALVRLEDDTERAEFNAAKIHAELQATRFARIGELHGKGLVSKDERDAAMQALREAEARQEQARVRLDLRTVYAPFAGVLGFRQVSPGALVQPGNPIVSLDAIETLRADFPVPETLIGLLDSGVDITARSAAWPGREFRGVIALIGTRVDEATRTVNVQAHVDNRDGALKPGMLLTVRLPARQRQVLFVPESALLPENARQYVWRIAADDSALRVEISPGVRHDGQVEVVAGLSAGDRVVVEGQGNLRDGRRVQEVTGSTPAAMPAGPAERAP